MQTASSSKRFGMQILVREVAGGGVSFTVTWRRAGKQYSVAFDNLRKQVRLAVSGAAGGVEYQNSADFIPPQDGMH